MDSGTRKAARHAEVLRVVRRIRRRWRTRVALRGMAIVLGASLVAFLLSVYGLELFRFSAPAVVTFRVLLWATVIGLVGRFLVWPLTRKVSDEQAALYLEEHEPSLQAAVLSALEAGGGAAVTSEALERRLVESALERARKVDYGRGIEEKGLYRASGSLAAGVLTVLALLVLGPAQLRHGVSALLLPTRDAATVNPYSITVSPGDVTIARGSDQMVTAGLNGFEADRVQIFFKAESSDAFDRLSMLPGDSAGFELLLLGLDEDTEYFVESAGIRSATYRIEVADLPYVDRLELEYHFPAYTGLPPRVVDIGGDIAALKGTEVKVRVIPTMLTPSGRLVVDGEAVDLTDGGDGTWLGSLTVERDGFYEIELARMDGELVPASQKYTIDVLTDQPPTISFSKPGRDTRASPVEELFLEAKADDDFGISELILIYSVNGEAEDTVRLFDSRPAREVTVAYTLYLEEFELEPGDLISYYAIAKDNNRAGGSRSVTSDIYFVQIRPFRIDFRQGEQAGGGGGGGAAESGLSELQRQVVAATFNLVRDRELFGDGAFGENQVSVRLAQGRVREQVQGLQERMVARGMGTDPEFQRIAELLPKAIEEMEKAEEILGGDEPKSAIPPEQKALQYLQKAEETYEAIVTQGGGGGGGGGGASAEDLADLFELELDKLKNQYETVERGERQQATEQLDETLEKLKELARRQQQEAERQRRRASQEGGGGSRGQRELADDTEETARRLERLARETDDPQLMETARQLREAADDMRRSAAGSGSSAGTADANAALDRLEDARRRLEQSRVDRLREDVESAVERARELTNEQREIEEQMSRLGQPGSTGTQEAARRLFERKESMTEELADLERQVDRLSAAARSGQRETAERLDEAANSIRDNKLKERVRYSRGLIGARDQDYTRQFEAETTRGMEELERHLQDAVGAVGESAQDGREQALDQTRDLVRSMETLSRRLGDRRDQQDQGGRQGEGGQQDQERPGGQQGQSQDGQGQGGPQGTDGQPRNTDQGGSGTPQGGAAGVRPGNVSPSDVRQFRREIRERGREARDLQRLLEQEGLNDERLDEVVAALRALDRDRVYSDLAEVERLQSQVIEGLKQLEFGLRRGLEGENVDRVFLSGSDDVPTGFRKLVEEYYKALARKPGG